MFSSCLFVQLLLQAGSYIAVRLSVRPCSLSYRSGFPGDALDAINVQASSDKGPLVKTGGHLKELGTKHLNYSLCYKPVLQQCDGLAIHAITVLSLRTSGLIVGKGDTVSSFSIVLKGHTPMQFDPTQSAK